MNPFRGHDRLAVIDRFFRQLLLIARSWSKVQNSEVPHRHGARLACNIVYFGHHVILTIVGTEWGDTTQVVQERPKTDARCTDVFQ